MSTESFLHSFQERAKTGGERIFASFDGRDLTFAELDRQSDAIAARLVADGVRPGDRVAVMLRNSLAAVAVIYGIAKARAAWVPLNVHLVGSGLAHVLNTSRPVALIAAQDGESAIRQCGYAMGETRLYVEREDAAACDLTQMLAGEGQPNERLPDADDVFSVMFTSGTTGPSKGVPVTYAMMLWAARGVSHAASVKDGDVFFLWEPFYHIGGAQVLLIPLLHDVRLAMVPGLSVSRFWQQVNEAGATHLHYLGGLFQMLLKQPPSRLETTHRVSIAWGGGLPARLWEVVQRRFGLTLRECYGMTEASSMSSCNLSGVTGSVGRALPWVGIEIVGDDGGPAAPNVPGEIVLTERAPGVLFSGYLDNPTASLRDGRFHTGDQGLLDADGNLFFLGRLADSIRCRGENVSAWEIEQVVAGHPDVEECAAIGVPAEIGEYEIKLFVKPAPDGNFVPEELADWLTGRLAKFQIPRYLEAIADFEKTPSKRIIKSKLSQSVARSWDRFAAAGEER